MKIERMRNRIEKDGWKIVRVMGNGKLMASKGNYKTSFAWSMTELYRMIYG